MNNKQAILTILDKDPSHLQPTPYRAITIPELLADLEDRIKYTTIERAIYRFFIVSEMVAPNGGCRISRGEGTKNIIANKLMKLGITFDEALEAVDKVGGDQWYPWLYDINPHHKKWHKYRFTVYELLEFALSDTPIQY